MSTDTDSDTDSDSDSDTDSDTDLDGGDQLVGGDVDGGDVMDGADVDGGDDTDGGVENPCPGQDDNVDIDNNWILDCLKNLLENGQFSTDVSGWSNPTGPGTAVYSQEDGFANGNSGSLLFSNENVSSVSTTIAVPQCIPAREDALYTVWGQYHITADQPSDVGAGFQLAFYSSDNCSSTSLISGGVSNSNYWYNRDTWETITHSASAKEGTQSV